MNKIKEKVDDFKMLLSNGISIENFETLVGHLRDGSNDGWVNERSLDEWMSIYERFVEVSIDQLVLFFQYMSSHYNFVRRGTSDTFSIMRSASDIDFKLERYKLEFIVSCALS